MFNGVALLRIAGWTAVRSALAAAGLACGVLQAHAQALPPLTVDQIATRMHHQRELRAAKLHSYESRREMTLNYKSFFIEKRASEVVEMTFTAPATKRFVVISSSGSALLRQDVFQREMDSEREAAARGELAVTPATYKMRLVGQDHIPQGDCYVLEVSPRARGKYGYQGRIWVQSPDFAIVRLEARPVQSPSFWLKNGQFHTEFAKVGDFWFPAKMVSSSHVRLGGEATLTIQYGPYRIISAEPVPSHGGQSTSSRSPSRGSSSPAHSPE